MNAPIIRVSPSGPELQYPTSEATKVLTVGADGKVSPYPLPNSDGAFVFVRPIDGVQDDWPNLMGVVVPAAIAAGLTVVMLPGKHGEKWQALTTVRTPQGANIIGTPFTRIRQAGTCNYAFTVGEEYDGPGTYTDGNVTTAQVNPGSNILPVNKTDYMAVGKWVIVTEPPLPGQQQYGMILQITAINGLNVTVDRPVRATLYSGSKVLVLNEKTAANINIQGNGMRISGSVGYSYVAFWYARDVHVDGLIADNVDGALVATPDVGVFTMRPGTYRCSMRNMRIENQVQTYGFDIECAEDSDFEELVCDSAVSQGIRSANNIDCRFVHCRAFNAVNYGHYSSGAIGESWTQPASAGCTIGMTALNSQLDIITPELQESTTYALQIQAGCSGTCWGGRFTSGVSQSQTFENNSAGFKFNGQYLSNVGNNYGMRIKADTYVDGASWAGPAGSYLGLIDVASVLTYRNLTMQARGNFNVSAAGTRVVVEDSSLNLANTGFEVAANCVLEYRDVKITNASYLCSPGAHDVCFRFYGRCDLGGADLAYSATGKVMTNRGQATLVNGTVDVDYTDLNANDVVQVDVATPGGTMGNSYKVTKTVGSKFNITSIAADGSTVATDTSVLNYSF